MLTGSRSSSSTTSDGRRVSTVNDAEQPSIQSLQIGDEAPDFTADSQVGSISFHDLIDGAWGLLVFFSSTFDPVHTTELGCLAKLKEEFDQRQVRVITVSPDTKMNNQKWILDTQDLQDCKVSFPLVADDRADICKEYGLVRPKGTTMQGGKGAKPTASGRIRLPTASLFIIDIDKRIRIAHHYSPAVGRNFYEIIRAVDALQLAFFHQVGTPCNWMQTEDVFISPEITSDAAQNLFPKGFIEIKHYFRLTPQPDDDQQQGVM